MSTCVCADYRACVWFQVVFSLDAVVWPLTLHIDNIELHGAPHMGTASDPDLFIALTRVSRTHASLGGGAALKPTLYPALACVLCTMFLGKAVKPKHIVGVMLAIGFGLAFSWP